LKQDFLSVLFFNLFSASADGNYNFQPEPKVEFFRLVRLFKTRKKQYLRLSSNS